MLKIEEQLDKKPDQLSGGQKQRVAIARGIAKRTDVFVLDDPLAGLDFKLREQLVDDLRGLNAATGASVLYITSDVDRGDDPRRPRWPSSSAGTIIESGAPERLYRDPRNVGTMALVGFPPANFLRGSLERRGDDAVCTTPLFRFRGGRRRIGRGVRRRPGRASAGADPPLAPRRVVRRRRGSRAPASRPPSSCARISAAKTSSTSTPSGVP